MARLERLNALARVPNLPQYAFAVGVMLLFLSGCKPMASHDEVTRLSSPGDSPVDAVLVEVNTGATDTFRYDVFVLAKGAKPLDKPVASLVGATRNDQAYGVNFRWQSPTHLRVEYLKARSVHQAAGTVHVGDRAVQIELVQGILDPSAPPGGMEYNLRNVLVKYFHTPR
ncbi:MAG: hypothetical protein Q4G71_14815 [Pseudomonadota bacterium]|nr:hypothetical protein [Pseudomonadota bacterium]